MLLLPGFPGGRIPRTQIALLIRPITEINSRWLRQDARKRTVKARKTKGRVAGETRQPLEIAKIPG